MNFVLPGATGVDRHLQVAGEHPEQQRGAGQPGLPSGRGMEEPGRAAELGDAGPEDDLTVLGTQPGISGWKTSGLTRWVTPETVKIPASRATSLGSVVGDIGP